MFGYNPLISDLAGLSDTALLERMQHLNKNINAAFTLGKQDLLYQLNVALDMCKSELESRQFKKNTKDDGPNPFKSIDIE